MRHLRLQYLDLCVTFETMVESKSELPKLDHLQAAGGQHWTKIGPTTLRLPRLVRPQDTLGHTTGVGSIMANVLAFSQLHTDCLGGPSIQNNEFVSRLRQLCILCDRRGHSVYK